VEDRGIDARTDRRWESPPTRDYRVVFWRGGSADERDLSDAEDVHDVIRWADGEAATRGATYTLFAKVDRGDDPGLVWLAGVDPTVWSRPNFNRPRP
jgi:hypothetical protein